MVRARKQGSPRSSRVADKGKVPVECPNLDRGTTGTSYDDGSMGLIGGKQSFCEALLTRTITFPHFDQSSNRWLGVVQWVNRVAKLNLFVLRRMLEK